MVLVVTIDTGLGTALFSDGHLLPNTELGHLLLKTVWGLNATLRRPFATPRNSNGVIGVIV